MADAGRPPVARWLWWAGFGALGLIAAMLTVLAYREGVPAFLQTHDKATHFTMAGALVFFLDGALARRSLRVARVPVPVACLVVLVPAAIEEYLQRYATFRTSDLGDYAADVLGAVVFLVLSRRVAA
jgi:VanZ family protein